MLTDKTFTDKPASKIAKIVRTATLALIAGGVSLGLAIPAEAASGTMYGDPTAAAHWWRHQKYDDCALMASADVIGQVTGKEPSEEAIVKKAQSTPSQHHAGSIYIKPLDKKNPNSGRGTSMVDVPTLLAAYNVKAVVSDKDASAQTGVPAGIEGLERLLGGGHKVIITVNAEMIWKQPNKNTDENGRPLADHAVVVTGIDTANNVVYLNDSGTKNGAKEQVSMDLFMQAWDSGDETVVVTT